MKKKSLNEFKVKQLVFQTDKSKTISFTSLHSVPPPKKTVTGLLMLTQPRKNEPTICIMHYAGKSQALKINLEWRWTMSGSTSLVQHNL